MPGMMRNPSTESSIERQGKQAGRKRSNSIDKFKKAFSSWNPLSSKYSKSQLKSQPRYESQSVSQPQEEPQLVPRPQDEDEFIYRSRYNSKFAPQFRLTKPNLAPQYPNKAAYLPLYLERSQHVNLKSYRELSLMTAPDCSSSDDKPLLQETIQPKAQPQSNVKCYDSGRNPFTDAFRVSVMSDTGENPKVFDASNAFDPPSKAAPLCQPHVVANTEMQRNKSCKVEVMHERKMRREEPIPPMPSSSRVATSTSTTRRGPPPEQHKKRAQPSDKGYTVEYYRFAPSSFGSRNYEVQRVATPEPKQRPLPVPPNSAQNSQAEYASSSRTGKQRQATRPLPAVPTDPTIYLRNLPIPPRNVSRTAV